MRVGDSEDMKKGTRDERKKGITEDRKNEQRSIRSNQVVRIYFEKEHPHNPNRSNNTDPMSKYISCKQIETQIRTVILQDVDKILIRLIRFCGAFEFDYLIYSIFT